MRGKGEGALFKDGRGLWTVAIELPPAANGDRRRKVIRSKDKAVALKKLQAVMKARDEAGGDLRTGDVSLEVWMTEWFENIAMPRIRPKTASTYRSLINREIIPTLGTRKLGKLTPADVRKLHASIAAKGLSTTTALQAHRILASALTAAHREGRVTRNVATLTDAPRKAVPKLEALSVAEAIKVLEVASTDPLGSLWAAVLLTGARQGELLGLEVDRVTDEIDLSWQLQRITWQHGCKADECGRKRGSDCPQRTISAPANFQARPIVGGLWWTRPKSKAGWRIIPLVDPLKAIIEQRIAVAALRPNPHGLVWTMPDGSPIDPRQEALMWDDLLKRAGVTDVRLHDGRHTTVDLLLEAGVPIDIIMEIVGHSSRAMTMNYKKRGNRKRLTEAMTSLSALITPQADEGGEIHAISA